MNDSLLWGRVSLYAYRGKDRNSYYALGSWSLLYGQIAPILAPSFMRRRARCQKFYIELHNTGCLLVRTMFGGPVGVDHSISIRSIACPHCILILAFLAP